MTFEPSVNLGTMIHLATSLVTALITVGCIYGAMRSQIGAMRDQIAGIRDELREIKGSIGCTDGDVAKLGEGTVGLRERVAALERDVAWFKEKQTTRESI